MIYKKLVRDKIPEIIAKQGKRVSVRVLHGDELKVALKDKLIEEAREFANAETHEQIVEELADVAQVVHAILRAYGLRIATISDKRMEKCIEKGDFSRGYFLESVDEETPCKHALKDELGDLYCGNDKSANLGDFCAVCGEYVPEGRQICTACEKKTHLNE